MHVPPPGALGSHQAIAVAWGVNAWQLGIFFKVSRIQNLMMRHVPVVYLTKDKSKKLSRPPR